MMRTPLRSLTFALGLAALGAAAAAAQQPRIDNGRVTAQPAGVPFAQSFRTIVAAQGDVAWIGYAVPAAPGQRVMCCGNSGTTVVSSGMVTSDGFSCCGACRLEDSGRVAGGAAQPPASGTGVVKLEGSDRMLVLYRIAERRVDRIRVFSADCPLDAGGRPVVWLE